MSVKLFYDPERVEHFRQRGIDPRARQQPLAAQARTALSAVEECARLRAEVARLKVDKQPAAQARTGPGSVEECARLRTEVVQLKLENQRLRDELAGSSRWSKREDYPPDDAAKRLELDIDQ